MQGSKYSAKTKAEALAVVDSCDGNVSEAARETSLPVMTLHDWKNGKGIDEEVRKLRKQKKEDLADIYEVMIRKGQELLYESMGGAKFGELSLAICQWNDKMNNARGKPDRIIENRTNSMQRDRILQAAADLAQKQGISETEALNAMLEQEPELSKYIQ